MWSQEINTDEDRLILWPRPSVLSAFFQRISYGLSLTETLQTTPGFVVRGIVLQSTLLIFVDGRVTFGGKLDISRRLYENRIYIYIFKNLTRSILFVTSTERKHEGISYLDLDPNENCIVLRVIESGGFLYRIPV